MLDKIIQELAQKDEINDSEWLFFSRAYADETCLVKKTSFLKALTAHSGIPLSQVRDALKTLNDTELPSSSKEQILAELQQTQTVTTLKISKFQQQHPLLNHMNIDILSISRANWNAIINKFEQQDRQKLTRVFFLSNLSSSQRVKYDQLVENLRDPQPERAKKRKIAHENAPLKRTQHSYVDDNGTNPLIYKSEINSPEDNEHIELETKLEATGVRVVPSLEPATPEKGYPTVMRTPGKSKVRQICSINGQFFFQPVTPDSKEPKTGRVDVRKASKSAIVSSLPKLLFERAEPVEYVATLKVITERSGKPRITSQSSKMGATAAAVFRAHGIEIKPADGRSKHWAHLIAHFLADTQELTTPNSDKEIINLVPSTAAANYNTLETVELFIKEKLVNKETDQIRINVNPTYSGESLIPDLLIYELTWKEENQKDDMLQCNETFYINPQSYKRMTKNEHNAISVLRTARKNLMFQDPPADVFQGNHIEEQQISMDI